MEICEHMKQYRTFYKHRFADNHFYQKFANVLNELLLSYLKNSSVSQYLSYGTTGYLNRWLDNNCETPIEEVAIGLAESGLPPILKAIEKTHKLA
ncbi:MAG: TetR-like C-terminal domain-containing protein [Candidatus Pristimantibacillus sp.]